jgi:hypothetical protein
MAATDKQSNAGPECEAEKGAKMLCLGRRERHARAALVAAGNSKLYKLVWVKAAEPTAS